MFKADVAAYMNSQSLGIRVLLQSRSKAREGKTSDSFGEVQNQTFQ
jgi:hypothetical protein